MKSQAIVMKEPGTLKKEELNVPEISAKEALIRINLCGVCATDVHMNKGGMDLNFPVIPGHEFAGTIEKLGADLKKDSKGETITEGDSITVVPGIVCGECWYCNNMPTRPTTCQNRRVYGFRNIDTYPYAHGGMSEYIVLVEDAEFYKLPETMDPELGALVEPMAVATHAFERAFQPGLPHVREGFGPGKSVAVQGAGPIGLLTVATAKGAGAGQIIVVDAIEERLDLAKKFGATDIVNFKEYDEEEELIKAVKTLTPGHVGPDIVLEAAGAPPAVRQGIEMVHDGGIFVELGHYTYAGEVEINPTRIVQKDLNIYGSLAYPPSQFEMSISLLNQLADEIPLKELFNYRVGLDEAEKAFEKQESGSAYRATIHP